MKYVISTLWQKVSFNDHSAILTIPIFEEQPMYVIMSQICIDISFKNAYVILLGNMIVSEHDC